MSCHYGNPACGDTSDDAHECAPARRAAPADHEDRRCYACRQRSRTLLCARCSDAIETPKIERCWL